MHTDFRYWLPFLTDDVPAALTSPAEVARFELDQALPRIAPPACGGRLSASVTYQRSTLVLDILFPPKSFIHSICGGGRAVHCFSIIKNAQRKLRCAF